MWKSLLALCSQQLVSEAKRDDYDSRDSGASMLLTELVRVDLKSRAEGRQIRNIDLAKRVLSGTKVPSIDD